MKHFPLTLRLPLLLLPALIAACGTFNLGNVSPQANKTADQQQLDILTCKDKANLAINSAGHQTADFFLGLTVVGAPVAYANDKSKAREVYAECMQARGYVVTLPGKTPTSTAPATSPAPVTPVPGADQLALAPPPGFALKAVPDNLKNAGAALYAVNRTLDIGMSVMPVPHEGVTDLTAFASTKKAAQVDRLKDGTSSEVTRLEVGGRNAVRYSVTGTYKNLKITYVTTLIEGQDLIVIVNAWAGATNAQQQMTVLESLAATVSGIS
jgi:hypothetical protein